MPEVVSNGVIIVRGTFKDSSAHDDGTRRSLQAAGGCVCAVHGKIRATKDVDIFIGTEEDNAAKVWRAFPVHYIGRADLIANKQAAARPQDLLDVEYLRKS